MRRHTGAQQEPSGSTPEHQSRGGVAASSPLGWVSCGVAGTLLALVAWAAVANESSSFNSTWFSGVARGSAEAHGIGSQPAGVAPPLSMPYYSTKMRVVKPQPNELRRTSDMFGNEYTAAAHHAIKSPPPPPLRPGKKQASHPPSLLCAPPQSTSLPFLTFFSLCVGTTRPPPHAPRLFPPPLPPLLHGASSLINDLNPSHFISSTQFYTPSILTMTPLAIPFIPPMDVSLIPSLSALATRFEYPL